MVGEEGDGKAILTTTTIVVVVVVVVVVFVIVSLRMNFEPGIKLLRLASIV